MYPVIACIVIGLAGTVAVAYSITTQLAGTIESRFSGNWCRQPASPDPTVRRGMVLVLDWRRCRLAADATG
jgi:hypothetical protein